MNRLVISHDAKLDLVGIFDYVRRERPQAAFRLIDRLVARMKLLRASPDAGELCERLGPEIRRTVVGRYAIYYQAALDDVHVLRVLHSAREMPTAFFEPPT